MEYFEQTIGTATYIYDPETRRAIYRQKSNNKNYLTGKLEKGSRIHEKLIQGEKIQIDSELFDVVYEAQTKINEIREDSTKKILTLERKIEKSRTKLFESPKCSTAISDNSTI